MKSFKMWKVFPPVPSKSVLLGTPKTTTLQETHTASVPSVPSVPSKDTYHSVSGEKKEESADDQYSSFFQENNGGGMFSLGTLGTLGTLTEFTPADAADSNKVGGNSDPKPLETVGTRQLSSYVGCDVTAEQWEQLQAQAWPGWSFTARQDGDGWHVESFQSAGYAPPVV